MKKEESWSARFSITTLPLPFDEWLAPLSDSTQTKTSNDTNRYPTTTTTATSTATSTATATSTDCCYMPAAGKPPRQPQRQIPPRYFPNPSGSMLLRSHLAHPLSGRKSRFHSPNRSVPLPCGQILSAPTGGGTIAVAEPPSKLSPPPGSKFVVFSAAQCLY